MKPHLQATVWTLLEAAASQPMATQAGLAVLQAGGNVMDAAVAASAVLCVTEPQATGIGGDCFLLYHEAKTGKLHGLNGSGRAPARATLEEFERRGLMQVPEFGILSVIVPATIIRSLWRGEKRTTS